MIWIYVSSIILALYVAFTVVKLCYEEKHAAPMKWSEAYRRFQKIAVRAEMYWPIVWVSRLDAQALFYASYFASVEKMVEYYDKCKFGLPENCINKEDITHA